MSILQRYVLRELIGPIVISMLFFSFLMMLRQLFRFAELLLEANVGIEVFLEFTAIIALSLIIITIPMATLLGTLVGIGRLTAENEILAMRVAGISLPRIFMPVVVFAACGSFALMLLGFNFLPGIFNRLLERQNEIIFETVVSLQPGRLYDELETPNTDISLFYEKRGAPTKDDGPHSLNMEQVAIRILGTAADLTGATMDSGEKTVTQVGNVFRESNRETLIFAEKGILVGNLEDRSITIKLQEGSIVPLNFVEIVGEDGKVVDRYREDRERDVAFRFASLEETFRPEIADAKERVDPSRMSFAELREAAKTPPNMEMYSETGRKRLRTEWRNHLSIKNEIWQRISLPWSLLSFVMIAIPLAVSLRPRAKTLSFLVAIGLIMVYYIMLTMAGAIGMSNSPLAPIAYLSPNILIGGIGLFLFWKVQR